jgi:protein-S-isoprenylcysteine O-methyltransferase Ste14
MIVWVVVDNIVIARNVDRGAKRGDRGSIFVLMLVGWLGWSAGIALAYTPHGRLDWHPLVFQIAGFFVFAAGLAIRATAIRQLGRFHSPLVEVKGDHQLVDQGLYGLVRHPSYLGATVAMIGIALTMANVYSLIIIPLAAFVGYLYRMHAEEALLLSELGDAYRAYSARTARIIPWVY